MTDPTHDLQALLSKIELFLDDLGSTSDESLEEADPALLGSYRDDAATLRDALTSLRASRPQEEQEVWQPIETAPKRRKVMVTWVNEFGHRRTTLACYFDAGQLDMDEMDDSADDIVDDDGKNADGGWFEERETGDPGYYMLTAPLTHWRLLPPTPTEGAPK